MKGQDHEQQAHQGEQGQETEADVAGLGLGRAGGWRLGSRRGTGSGSLRSGRSGGLDLGFEVRGGCSELDGDSLDAGAFGGQAGGDCR